MAASSGGSADIAEASEHLRRGDDPRALSVYEAILDDQPDHVAARLGLVGCLSRQPRLVLRMRRPQRLREALAWEQIDPQLLAVAAATRLRLEPDDSLVYTLLREAIVTDRELEASLTAARRELCLDPPAQMPLLAAALAQQGLLNEYAWAVSDEEARHLQGAPHWVQAMYADVSTTAPPESLIPELTQVRAGTSARVRQQYEENPYPRWQRLTLGEPEPLDRHLTQLVPGWHAPEPLRHPEVLVAGCGTGQDLLAAARAWQPACITGVDLSLASLGYAQRKADEYGLDVDLCHGDLLELGEWDRQFDVITCTGVLHHLEDPMQGWRQLVRLLRPGGVMLVGLYSRTARQGIAVAQDEVRDRGFSPTTDGIRTARTHLNHSELANDCALLLDYFHTSGCRDLLFHVKEHTFTIPDIERALAELGLTFLDFETAPHVRQRYRTLFGLGVSLPCWDAFEQMYPRTFLGMYRFWVQRPL
jgi:2-polyprenyl-3-methyl-5-hydroxy-6-metoxy-1,4-benzoquinol methylase